MVIVVAITSQAQSTNYKAFKVNIGLGYAIPMNTQGSGQSGGAAFSLEPQYRINDAINVGLRFEGAAIANVNSAGSSANVSVLGSYTASGEYYFKPTGFRLLAGAGAGIYTMASASVSSGSGGSVVTVPATSTFGFYPRVGFETGHFRVTSEYNFVKNGGYLAFKLGFFLGGGKKTSNK